MYIGKKSTNMRDKESQNRNWMRLSELSVELVSVFKEEQNNILNLMKKYSMLGIALKYM
jgi:hypothetical protein